MLFLNTCIRLKPYTLLKNIDNNIKKKNPKKI